MTHLDLRSSSFVTHKPVYLRFGKRLLDVVLALALLPWVALVLGGVYLMSARGQGPFFFAHDRVGQNGHRFKCWKIRTMVPDAQARLDAHLAANPQAAAEWDRTHKLRDDPRVTRFGRMLRRTSLDELPQLWNVLRGDMSFVGPRPVTADELGRYGTDRQTYLDLKPGITGHWQIHGRGNGCYVERTDMDRHYATTISLTRDLMLIAATVTVVFRPTGR